LGVVLGAMIGSAALIGALVVGDSVRQSLKDMALNRLGPIHYALFVPDGFFESNLGRRLHDALWPMFELIRQRAADHLRPYYPTQPGGGPGAALLLPGIVAKPDGSGRLNHVNVLGVDAATWPRMANWGGLGPGVRAPNADGIMDLLDEVTRMELGRGEGPLTRWRRGETALVNQSLARQLGVAPGDAIVVRARKPAALGLDATITPRDEDTVALRLEVGAILTPEMLGEFSLSPSQVSPANVFVDLEVLQEKAGARGKANLLVMGGVAENRPLSWWDGQRLKLTGWFGRRPPLTKTVATPNGTVLHVTDWTGPFARGLRVLQPQLSQPVADPQALPWLADGLERATHPEDAGLSVRILEPPPARTGGEAVPPAIEVSSSRIFLDAPAIEAALKPRTQSLADHVGFHHDTPGNLQFDRAITNGQPVITYLANLIRLGDRATPYSMVAAVGDPFTPPEMRDDEILINEWLAQDLNARPGDSVQLSYYLPDSGAALIERTNSFRIRGIVPLKGVHADRALMPEFPGLAKAESTHDWNAGFPLAHTIRDQDEAYWKAYRGTPKAFITLAAGQQLWANRFGKLTSIRFEAPPNASAEAYRAAIYARLAANLNPAAAGLRFEPVRAQALRAANQAQDFGQLFLGFSFFLVLAALLLMALMFHFSLDQRAAEVGVLLALGFTPRMTRRLFLLEGAALAVAGGLIGAVCGLGYARAMLLGLTTIWRDAVGTSGLRFHATPATLLVGFLASLTVAVFTIWLTLRKQARQPARELLAGELSTAAGEGGRRARWVGVIAGLGALGIALAGLVGGETANAGAFFGAGALLLVSGLAWTAAWLDTLARQPRSAQLTLAGLGLRACARRRKRSVATVALLASGSFLILAIGVFRLDANHDAFRPSSGTGGFALIGESTLPILQDLNTKAGREAFGLGENDLPAINVVPFRVRQGDEASCLNLNRAQRPRLLGASPDRLRGRFTFAAAARGMDARHGWDLLSPARPLPGLADEIPAIGDANSIQWALGRKLGDTIDYTDEAGRAFKLRLVGAVANSILQGGLVIDEREFVKRFPNESGYRMLLVDAPSNSVAGVSAALSRALQDQGLELTSAARRLDAFNAVQNTYLSTFQILGGLGLLVGSAGLGAVVLRNVLERRGELGLMVATGYRPRRLRRLLLGEHGALLAAGLGLGILAAAVAVLPSLLAASNPLPIASLALTLAAILLNGLLWTWLAARYALRGNLLAALRNE
jgi:ABC-type antimicrobial peptide transport system permease subunit